MGRNQYHALFLRLMGASCVVFALHTAWASLSPIPQVTATTRYFGPQNPVIVARPELRWEVWSKTAEVVSAGMKVNGASVSARYDKEERSLIYRPSKDLPAGKFVVDCEVVFTGDAKFERSWSGEVLRGAMSAFPAPTPGQVKALFAFNQIRAKHGLPAAAFDERLNFASLQHAKYLAENNIKVGHFQQAIGKGFFGEKPSDRTLLLGFPLGTYEGATYGFDNIRENVQHLFDAPYHRIPALQLGPLLVGTGISPKRLVMQYGLADRSGISVSPSDGQKEVPTIWVGKEIPDPFAIHGATSGSGYPIVFSWFSSDRQPISLITASINLENGGAVPAYINSPDNDRFLQDSVFILPKESLKPGTTYQVEVKVRRKSGEMASKTWSFTTVGIARLVKRL